MIIYKEPIKKQNDETWGQIPVPMFFFCEATKIHGSHSNDTDLSCVGASEKVTQKSIIGLFSLSHEQN